MNITSAFRERFHGPVYGPGDDGYDEGRRPWNLAVDQHPAAVVMAESAEDVQAAVTLARENDLPLAVQSSGHGAVHACDDGMVLNVSRLSSVDVDPTHQRARITAGTRWREVLEAADPHGLAPLSGTSLAVGVTGYTLGGGLGVMMRRFGFAADSVMSATVVTADGASVPASETENADLFWALKGGSGNFGVLTSLEFQMYPIREVYNGMLVYPGDRAAEVLQAWSEWTRDLPDDVTAAAMLVEVPPLPMIPEPLRGRRVVMVRALVTDGNARPIDSLRSALGTPIMDTFGPMSYLQAALSSMEPEEPAMATGRSALTGDLSASTIERIAAMAEPESPVDVVGVRHLGGAASNAPRQPSAICHRDASYLLEAHAIVPSPDHGVLVDDYLSRAFGDLQPALHPGAFLNFLPAGTSVDDVRAVYTADTYARLQDVKRVHDPDNVFAFNHNIPPAN